MRSPLDRPESVGHGERDSLPALRFGLEASAAGARELVEPGAALGFRLAPFGRKPAGLFHAVEGREKRSSFDLECSVGDLGDATRDAHAVHLIERERFQDQEIEGALEKFGFCIVL